MSDDHIFTKCAWRLIPLTMVLYLVNYIDRVNVGFAALTMNKDLNFSPVIFGFGAGVFFLGYFFFQVPANWILERVGARRWMFCILVAWGSISAANALVQDPTSFYVVRFLLGVAEAGFFPGMILYLTYWFPQAYLARYFAMFATAIPLAFVIGGPLASVILSMEGVAGLHGWQWLFILEGMPAVFLAFAVLKLLPDGPARAAWLTTEEKALIAKRLASDEPGAKSSFWLTFRDPRVFVLGIALFGITAGGQYGVGLWLPQIVQRMGFSNQATGLIVALPYIIAVAAMVLWGRSSDIRRERVWHVAIPLLCGAGGFAIASVAQNSLLQFVGLTVTAVAAVSSYPPMNSLLKSMLSRSGMASGIALYNSIGNLGGFAGPYIIGALQTDNGGNAASMAILSMFLVFSASIVLGLGRVLALGQQRHGQRSVRTHET